ncbi:TetR family transcriptional regulator, partial [Streptomyces sp. NPDC054783]
DARSHPRARRGLDLHAGVNATNSELVRRAAGVSGSQLSHYFANKESLVRAVIDWQAEGVLGFHFVAAFFSGPTGSTRRRIRRDSHTGVAWVALGSRF